MMTSVQEKISNEIQDMVDKHIEQDVPIYPDQVLTFMDVFRGYSRFDALVAMKELGILQESHREELRKRREAREGIMEKIEKTFELPEGVLSGHSNKHVP